MRRQDESALRRKCCQYMDKFDNILYWYDRDSRKNKAGKLDLEIHIRYRFGDVRTLLVELKNPRGGRIEPEQLTWLEFFSRSNSTVAFVTDDFDEFCDIINVYRKETTQ